MHPSTYMRYLELSNSETESRIVVNWSWGEGNEKLLFNQYRVSVLQDEVFCGRMVMMKVAQHSKRTQYL